MTFRVIRTGHDPITKPALEYLVALGVPANDIRRIEVDSEIGEAQIIRVTIMVRPKEGEAS